MSPTATVPEDVTPPTQPGVMLPPGPPMPPAPPATGMVPEPNGPLTGLTIGPWAAIGYAVLVIVFNVALQLVVALPAVREGLRALVASTAGVQAANRGLITALLVAGVSTVGYLILLTPAVALARARGVRFTEAFGLHRFRLGQTFWLTAAVVFGGLFVTVGYALFLRGFGISAPNNTVALVQGFGSGPAAMAVGFVLVAVIAPFVEEVTFRGVVFAGLRARWGMVAAVIVSGLLFGIVHLEPLETVPLAIIGMGLAGVFARSRSLWPAIIAHGCYNAVVLAIAFGSAGLLR